MIDRNMRWLEVTELDDVTASTVVSGFLRTWVSRYGVLVSMVTDRGIQFTGKLWSTMCMKLHISHRTMTSYHPESNGMIERVRRTLKASVRAKCQSASCPSSSSVSGQLPENRTQFRMGVRLANLLAHFWCE